MNHVFPQLPSVCMVCGTWPSLPICHFCSERFIPTQDCRCLSCALPMVSHTHDRRCAACLRKPPLVRHCHAAVDYRYPWSGLEKQFKFAQQLGLAQPFAQLLLRRPAIVNCLMEADYWLPVPLSSTRLVERGYNQAQLLATALQKLGGYPNKILHQTLIRLRLTTAQARLTGQERVRNAQGAFAFEPTHLAALKKKRLLLIDDVMTTGATLSACAQALASVQPVFIDALVFARADSRHAADTSTPD